VGIIHEEDWSAPVGIIHEEEWSAPVGIIHEEDCVKGKRGTLGK
jgi:hypothetical protein